MILKPPADNLIAAFLRASYRKTQAELQAETDKRKEEARIRRRAGIKALARKRRIAILNAYGNKCACCGEATPEFLTIDHVNGDGAAHRREVGEGGSVYAWLKKNGYPQDGRFQLLCYNCNCAKGFYGACPHTRKTEPSLTLASG